MIGCGKKVRFILAWQTYSVGDEIEPTAMDRDWLLARGYVEDVRPARLSRKAAAVVQTSGPAADLLTK